MNQKLGWGILGTGKIAGAFAQHLPRSRTGRLMAVGSRSRESAEQFAREHGGARPHASYDALLADPQVQAVYIATPHPVHAEWAIRAAAAGKHVLCEKPIGMNHAEAMRIIEAAVEHDVFLMEAFMYRCHPQTHRLTELIRDGAIGEVRVIHATFSFHWPKPFNTESRVTNHALGGGGILDVGCYCMSLARLIAGVAQGRDFAEPVEICATGHVGAESRVNEYAIASLKFPGGIVAQLSTGVQCNQESVVRIDGSDGSILIPAPWVPARDGGSTRIILTRHDQKRPRDIVIDSPQPIYAIEADLVAENLHRRQAPPPAMTWEDTLGNMRALDRWRAAIGMVYDVERLEHFPRERLTIPRRAGSKPIPMKFGRIEGLDTPVSRLVMGCDNQPDLPRASAMFDDFLERGGNAFDTAFIYRMGFHEALLGQWIKLRGVREDVVVIVKGAHTPYCDPRALSIQLAMSLDRLGTDHADIYLMHRDNPLVPVGEFVDVLNEHRRAGQIRVFGGSNWSIERMQAANDYAKEKGLVGFSVLSNQFSLARMVEPPWRGCLSAGDEASRQWLTETQTPLLAWSSQAQGFFATDPADATPMQVRCWHNDDNLHRRNRARELAGRKGVHAMNIALAYVLHQPFPTFALIGPRQLSETRTAWAALEVELAKEELRWLDLKQ